MDFWGIGTGEILLVLLVALIVFGPGRVVEIGRTLGRMMNTIKRTSSDFTTQITRELNTGEKPAPPQLKSKTGDRAGSKSPSRREDGTKD